MHKTGTHKFLMTGRNAEILQKYHIKNKTVHINSSTFYSNIHIHCIIFIIVLQELKRLTPLQSEKLQNALLHIAVKEKKVITWKRNTNCKLQFLISFIILSILMKDRT